MDVRPPAGHRPGAGRLAAGDYAVVDGERVVAAVERKSLADLVATMTAGKLRYLLAELATLPAAAVVVEDRYSAVFKLDRVRPATIAEGLGEAAARFSSVPIVFAETRPLAQEWTYRFLGAALAHHDDDAAATELAAAPPAGWAGAAAGADDGGGPGVGSAARAGGRRSGTAAPGRLGCLPQRRRRGRDRPCRHRAALNDRTITRPGRGAPVASVLVSGSHPGGADR